MRIVVTGDKEWSCPDLAARILRRLVARYGRDIVIIHGNEPGVDASFDAAAKEMGLIVETRVIDRKNTGFPTVGQRNRELLLGGADMYRGSRSHCGVPQDARLCPASLTGWNPDVWDRERARDPPADQAGGFVAEVKLRRRSIAKLL
jgi:hypothetical protein